MKTRIVVIVTALIMGVAALTACGGRGNKSGKTAQTKAPEKQAKPEVPAKKWYEQDFSLTEKMYVSRASMSRVYARKGNVLIFKMEGSQTTNLFICTDSTRTGYVVNEGARTYTKKSEKTDFDSVDEAIYDYLRSSMSNTIFGERLQKNGKGVSVKDTTIFGRPAYVLTHEKTEDVVGTELYTKVIEWVDKENGLPYYKYGLTKKNGAPYIEGKSFEVTSFSAEPTYEGLVVSLDGLTETAK
ncbi:MAG: hypothetical protein IJU27_05775 [Bacteroidales bacterium]|nr:hypothetical protein [Bacteroidales bacterium]